MHKIVAYIRTSHKERHRSGLGEEAQLEMIHRYSLDTQADVLGVLSDVDTGENNDRPGLQWAIDISKKTGATLVVAKLDRLSRRVDFISALMRVIDFKVAEMPTAEKFQLHMMASVAELERDMISRRTKGALDARRARGLPMGSAAVIAAKGRIVTVDGVSVVLRGTPGYVKTSHDAAVYRAKAAQMIEEINNGRWHTDKTIAAELNRRGEKTMLGAVWTARRVGEMRRRGTIIGKIV